MTPTKPVTPVTILARLFDPERIELSSEAAESLLKLDFDEADRQRMTELAEKNQAGGLSEEERAELESYRQVAALVDLIRAKARLTLNKYAAVR